MMLKEIVMVQKRHGFTLIELLITVLITSIVVMAAYMLVTATTGNFDREDDLVQLRANLRNAEMLIQRDIGRVAFRSGFVMNNDGVRSDVAYQAFTHSRVQLKDSGGQTRSFSQMTIVGDITDFGYFQIRMAQGGKNVEFEKEATNAIQSNDCLLRAAKEGSTVRKLTCPVGFCDGCGAGAAEADSTKRAEEAVVQSFEHASAVRFTSIARNESAIRLLSTSTPVSGTVISLSKNLTLPDSYGFAAMLIGDRATPIISMTYSVVANGDEFDLVRCNHAIDINRAAGVVPNSCAIVLRNVTSFDVFPIMAHSNINQLTQLIANNPLNTANLTWQSLNFDLKDLTGVFFRIAVRSDQPAKGVSFDATANAASYLPPFEVVNGQPHHVAYIQSSATIFSSPGAEEFAAFGAVPIHSAQAISFSAGGAI